MNATQKRLLLVVLVALLTGCRCLGDCCHADRLAPNNWCWGDTCATAPTTATTTAPPAYLPPALAAHP
jgi:hypothetical protein